jgi:hypothetical protein
MMDRDPRVAEQRIRDLAKQTAYEKARADRLQASADALRVDAERLRAALRQILEDPDATILDSHRDDGWEALGEI